MHEVIAAAAATCAQADLKPEMALEDLFMAAFRRSNDHGMEVPEAEENFAGSCAAVLVFLRVDNGQLP